MAFNFDLGLPVATQNVMNGIVKVEQDFQNLFTTIVSTVTDFLDDFFYQISELVVKIVNVLEVFTLCLFTWLLIYSILYPQDLFDKGMQIATLASNTIGGAVHGASRLII